MTIDGGVLTEPVRGMHEAAEFRDVTVELAVLDMAGTTVQDAGLVEASFTQAAEATGIVEDAADFERMIEYVRDTMGQSKIQVFRALSRDEATAQAANVEFERAYLERVASVTAIPQAEETMGMLREAGAAVALTTGFSRATMDAIVEELGWQDVADVMLCPADVGRGRPFPDLPLTALLRTGAPSVESMIVVGDTASDIRSGCAAGAGLVVGVLTGAHDDEQLGDAGADEIIASVASLPAMLGLGVLA
ncbi:phosphonatase-like hydrolase [Paramicrobacterium sp. CJ85]|uniref:phosphonatase-like hydrolase n=1 Tax=Paramicrobacterium sp. CJ85 TaxID=3445355 RepID=UPI003F643A53